MVRGLLSAEEVIIRIDPFQPKDDSTIPQGISSNHITVCLPSHFGHPPPGIITTNHHVEAHSRNLHSSFEHFEGDSLASFLRVGLDAFRIIIIIVRTY